jgi:hypothetical protein
MITNEQGAFKYAPGYSGICRLTGFFSQICHAMLEADPVGKFLNFLSMIQNRIHGANSGAPWWKDAE